MKARFEHIDDYLEQERPAFADKLRALAANDLRKFGFPALKTESWKYTSAKSLLREVYQPANDVSVHVAAVQDYFVAETDRLVFVNGILSEALSDCSVQIKPISAATEYLGETVSSAQTGFAALNTVLFEHGYYLEINTSLERPLHILHLATELAGNDVIYNRNLIVVNNVSSAEIIEQFVGLNDASYWRNMVTEVILKDTAKLSYYKLQQETETAKHTHFLGVQQLAGSDFTSYTIDLGGQLVRNDLQTALQGTEACCDLQGVYLLNDVQHIDNHTVINHLHATTYSNEYYKGILQNKAHAVFNGRVLVAQDAQKVDSHQKNANLLMSDECEIDTKPELEIYADDVKCAHGATIGQLDEKSIFYLQARGISESMARKMLTFGFAYEVVETVKQPIIHQVLKEAVLNWFSSDETLQELLR